MSVSEETLAELTTLGVEVRVTPDGAVRARPKERQTEHVIDLLRTYRRAVEREAHDRDCRCADLGEHFANAGSHDRWRELHPKVKPGALEETATIEASAESEDGGTLLAASAAAPCIEDGHPFEWTSFDSVSADTLCESCGATWNAHALASRARRNAQLQHPVESAPTLVLASRPPLTLIAEPPRAMTATLSRAARVN